MTAKQSKYLENSLRGNHYLREYKAVLYEGASHLLGMMPGRKQNPMLYKLIPLIGIFYRRFRENRKVCMDSLEQSEKEIVEWIENSTTGECLDAEKRRVGESEGVNK